MNAFYPQKVTLADIMEVISKGYRSVSDEEVAKYTEFMRWFAGVAKSACPHAGKSFFLSIAL